jgi:hypothetical protein
MHNTIVKNLIISNTQSHNYSFSQNRDVCLWHIIEEHDNVKVKLKTKRVDVIMFYHWNNVVSK